LGQLQDLFHSVGFLATRQVVVKRSGQSLFIPPLYLLGEPSPEHGAREPPARVLEILLLAEVDVADPFRDARQPGLPAESLDPADDVVVAERAQPAEDLADDSDQ
jgi:hypothetical protein